MSVEPIAPKGLRADRAVARSISNGIPSFRRMLVDAIERGELDLNPANAIDCDQQDHHELAVRLYQLEEIAERLFDAYSRGASKKRLDALFMELLDKNRAARRALTLTGTCASGLCGCSACKEKGQKP